MNTIVNNMFKFEYMVLNYGSLNYISCYNTMEWQIDPLRFLLVVIVIGHHWPFRWHDTTHGPMHMSHNNSKMQLIGGPLSLYWVILSMANNTIEIYIRNIIARCSIFVWILKCSWSLVAFKRDQTLYKALLLWYKRSYPIVLIFEWFCRPRRLLPNATWKYHFCNIIWDE